MIEISKALIELLKTLIKEVFFFFGSLFKRR